MRWVEFVVAIGSFGLLSGCTMVSAPLVFGKVNTFGASVAVTAPDQGGNLTVGYRSANVAIVPVAVVGDDGRPVKLVGHVKGTGSADDAYSTFSHFEANVGATLKACLGDTFATGLAAQKLSDNLAKICP